MSRGSGELVRRRRSGAEIQRLGALYQSSGLSRSDFCRRHGMGLSTLGRYLQRQKKSFSGSDGGDESRLVAVELAPVDAVASAGVLTVLLSNGRRVEVGRGFDAETLARLVAVLGRL